MTCMATQQGYLQSLSVLLLSLPFNGGRLTRPDLQGPWVFEPFISGSAAICMYTWVMTVVQPTSPI